MFTSVEAFDELLIVAATATGAGVAGPLSGTKILAFTNTLLPSKVTKLTDLVEAAYTGYAQVPATWSPAERGSDGFISTLSTRATFQMTSGATPTVITGIALVGGTTPTLYMLGLLDAQYALNDQFDALNVSIRWEANNPQASNIDVLS